MPEFLENSEKLCRLVVSVLLMPLLLRARWHVRQEEEQGPSIYFLEIAFLEKFQRKAESIISFI